MTHAILALQTAIYVRLKNDNALKARLGPNNIHDRVPPKKNFPYITFGAASTIDWSTDHEQGDEHLVLLQAWSRGRGRKEALELIELAEAALNSAPLQLADHHCVLLVMEGMSARFDPDLRGYVAAMRLRVHTEKLS